MPPTKTSYLIGLLVLFASAYSQYLFGGFGLVLGALVVYGVPLLVITLLWGLTIVRKSLNNTYAALKYGLGFFGAFTVLGLFASILIFYVLATFDPNALNLLQRPNPVLNVSPEFAWIMVWFSLLVVGPAEEYLFRGFVYGGLLGLFKNRHWMSLAVVSSILFAATHLYYAVVYGLASAIQFTDLVTFGMAMASTYYLSNGNLLIPAFVHGAYDATGFIGVAVSADVGAQLRGYMLAVGILVAIVLFIQKMRTREPLSTPISR